MSGSRPILVLVDASDRAFESLRQIETVAGLLQAAGARLRSDPVDASLVAGAALMILDEADKLRAFLKELQ